MKQNIPPEAQAQIAAFEAEAAEKRRARPQGEKKNKERRLEEFFEGRQPRVNCGDIETVATRLGVAIEGGGGKHGKHLVGPDDQRCSLPDHGGRDLATGTASKILDFLRRYYDMSRQQH